MRLQDDDEAERAALLERKRRRVLASMADDKTRAHVQTLFRTAAGRFSGGVSSLEPLRMPAMAAEVFRGLAARLLGLTLSKTELGALVLELFGLEPIERGEVPAEDFLRRFLAAGQEERRRERAKQLRREETRTRAAEGSARRSASPDSETAFSFSSADEARALERLAEAGARLDRSSLAGSAAVETFLNQRLTPSALADGVRLLLGVSLSRQEAGAVFARLSAESGRGFSGQAVLRRVLRLGEARRTETRAAETRRRELEQMEQARLREKYEVVVPTTTTFVDADLESARRKLKEAATRFHGDRRTRLSELYSSSLGLSELRHLLRRELALDLSASEAAALGSLFVEEEERRQPLSDASRVNGSAFIAHFLRLVSEERKEQRTSRRRRARERRAEQLVSNEERERQELAISADFNFDESLRVSTLQKLSLYSGRYERGSPSAVPLEPFEGIDMSPAVMQQTLFRLVGLRLSKKELGVLFKEFAQPGSNFVRSHEFLMRFVRAGIEQREIWRKARVAKLKEKEEAAQAESLRRQQALALQNAAAAAMNFSISDKQSAFNKLGKAYQGIRRLGGGVSELSVFENGIMDAATLRDSLRKVFNIYLTPKELGAVMTEYDSTKEGFIRSKVFLQGLVKFCGGKAPMRRQSPLKITSGEKAVKNDNSSPSDDKDVVDWQFEAEHIDSLITKLEGAMLIIDSKSLDVLSGTRLNASELRSYIVRILKVSLTPFELGALMNKLGVSLLRGSAPAAASVDSLVLKSYLIRLRHSARGKENQRINEMQRQRREERAAKAARRKLLEEQRAKLDEEYFYSDVDKDTAFRKLTEASVKYDRTSPTCVSLECFKCAYLTSNEFRDAMRLSFNIFLTNKELAALMESFEYKDSGLLDCSAFINAFVKVKFYDILCL